MAYEDGADYERTARIFYYGILAVMVCLAIYLSFKPGYLANSKAFGCYTAPEAPPILLDQHGMSILQPAAMRISYHLERHKTGIALTVDAPIAADRVGERYVFSIRPPGGGWYLDFFNVINGHTYGVFDENQLRQFTMLAKDGAYLPYKKVPADACRTTPSPSAA